MDTLQARGRVTPRGAAVFMLLFTTCRILTPFGMMFMNMIPQTVLMVLSIGLPVNTMLMAFLKLITAESGVVPDFLFPYVMTPEFVRSL